MAFIIRRGFEKDKNCECENSEDKSLSYKNSNKESAKEFEGLI
jgi:hypothetical protein